MKLCSWTYESLYSLAIPKTAHQSLHQVGVSHMHKISVQSSSGPSVQPQRTHESTALTCGPVSAVHFAVTLFCIIIIVLVYSASGTSK